MAPWATQWPSVYLGARQTGIPCSFTEVVGDLINVCKSLLRSGAARRAEHHFIRQLVVAGVELAYL